MWSYLPFSLIITIIIIIERKQKLWVSGELMHGGKILKDGCWAKVNPSHMIR